MEERHDYCIINPSIRLSFFRAAPINIPTVILYFKMSQLSGVIIEILLEHLNTIAEVLPLRRVSRDVKIKADRRICGLILALASSHHHDYMDDHEIVRPGEFVVYLSQDEREDTFLYTCLTGRRDVDTLEFPPRRHGVQL